MPKVPSSCITSSTTALSCLIDFIGGKSFRLIFSIILHHTKTTNKIEAKKYFRIEFEGRKHYRQIDKKSKNILAKTEN